VAASRPRPLLPTGPNSVWAYDFVYDACANGQQIKCLTVIDEFTRECLSIDVAGSIRPQRVVDILTRLISEHGAPRILRSDNGPEFVSKKILNWIVESRIDIAHIDPGKPWQNGTDGSFNGRLRDECLSLEWFRSRLEARVIIEQWRRHYNEVRPTRAWITALPSNSGNITIFFNPEPLSSNSVTEVSGASHRFAVPSVVEQRVSAQAARPGKKAVEAVRVKRRHHPSPPGTIAGGRAAHPLTALSASQPF